MRSTNESIALAQIEIRTARRAALNAGATFRDVHEDWQAGTATQKQRDDAYAEWQAAVERLRQAEEVM